MGRTPCSAQAGLKKGSWTPEEDRKLFAYVTTYGHWNWRQLPKYAGLARCGKSCRLRWMNYLRPNIKRGNYTKEEEDRIIRLHESLGNKWSAIAAQLPGRTDNEVKNHWHTSLKKRLKQNSSTRSEAAIDIQTPKDHLTFCNNPEINQEGESKITFIDSQDDQESNLPESSSSPASGQMSTTFTTTDVTSSAAGISSNHEFEYWFELPYAEPSECFWSEPFLADDKFFDFSVNSPFVGSDIILWP